MSLEHLLCDRYFHSLLFILTEILCSRLYYPHSKDGKMGLTEIIQVVTAEPHDKKYRTGLEPTSTQPHSPCLFFYLTLTPRCRPISNVKFTSSSSCHSSQELELEDYGFLQFKLRQGILYPTC